MNEGCSVASTCVNGTALAELLEEAGLLDWKLASQVAHLGQRFPVAAQSNMFLEYELGQQPVPAGFGVGFAAGTLDHYAATDHWFLESPVGRAIGMARSVDPFAADHAAHLNLFSDPDPDWIEYDIADGRIDPTPFIFFRAPSRFQTISTPEQVQSFCDILPVSWSTADFGGLLTLMIARAPASVYRVGTAQRRGKGWWRVIITNLQEDQVIAALSSRGATDFSGSLDMARRFYAGRMDTPGACFALSIDIGDGGISAMDVECPYFFRIGDPVQRRAACAALLRQLTGAGSLSVETADWLAGCCRRDVVVKDARQRLRVMVHHLKCRFLGSPHLRTKAYLHLEVTEHPAHEAVS